MWYGFKSIPDVNKILRRKTYRLNMKDRKFGSPLPRRDSYPETSFAFRIPLDWKLIVLQHRSLTNLPQLYYLYSQTYYVNFSLFGSYLPVYYDKQTHTLNFKLLNPSYNYQAYLKMISDLLSRFSRPFFLKIRFKGKGYYMYKTRRNTIAPQMGYAHRVYVYANAINVKFLSKTKILLFGLSKQDVFLAGYSLLRVKPINIFTGRGVRFARQVIYRKTGKVGAYR